MVALLHGCIASIPMAVPLHLKPNSEGPTVPQAVPLGKQFLDRSDRLGVQVGVAEQASTQCLPENSQSGTYATNSQCWLNCV